MKQKIIVAGGSGFVGQHLIPALEERGHQVTQLLRAGSRASADATTAPWDPNQRRLDPAVVDGSDVVINLCGRNIGAGRWTPKVKKELLDSRLDPTSTLVEAITAATDPPRLLINSSATGIYGDRGDEELDESSTLGTDFLADLAAQWEGAAIASRTSRTAVALLRLGMVIGDGGALAKMLPAFRLGLGGPIGDGRQWWPWIAMDDVVGVILRLVEGDAHDGPVNLVSPEACRCREFTRALGKALHRPAVIPAPRFALRTLFGEMADALLLASAQVRPTALSELGYGFRAASLSTALSSALRRS